MESEPKLNLIDEISKYFPKDLIQYLKVSIYHGARQAAAEVLAVYYEQALSDEQKDMVDENLLSVLQAIATDRDLDVYERDFALLLWQELMSR
jgi:hypothetical protein